MKKRWLMIAVSVFLAMQMASGLVFAGSAAKIVLKQATRSLERTAGRAAAKALPRAGTRMLPSRIVPRLGAATHDGSAINRIMRKDLAAHMKAPVRTLESPRWAYRYTSRKAASLERRTGVPSGRHLTTGIGPGRPMGSARAQRTFGLPMRPEIREKVLIPKGTRVKFGTVQGGAPRRGEVFTQSKLPRTSVRARVRLK